MNGMKGDENMKKFATLVLAIVVFSLPAFPVTFGLKGIYFSPADKTFKDVYGGGPMYGAEIGIKIVGGLSFWISGGYYAKNGILTYTKEETKLTIIPVGGGLRYEFLTGAVSPYLGAGANYYFYKESNPIGRVDKGGVGFVGRAGVVVRITRWFLIDLNAGYSYCRFKPADFTVNIGGIEGGAGLTFSF
jgi:hypothetical protein